MTNHFNNHNMTQEEIKKICIRHNVAPEGAVLFYEDWIVSRTGDLIGGRQYGWEYGIYDNNQEDDNWLTHMCEKEWCDIFTFIPAFIEALCRRGITEKKVTIGYGGKECINPFDYRGNAKRLNELSMRVKRSVNEFYSRHE